MIFSVSNIAWNPSDRLKIYKIMNQNNFKGLEIAPGLLFPSSINPLNPTQGELKRVRRELISKNLKLVSIQSLLFKREDAFLFGNSYQRTKFMNAMIDVIKFAGRLEIPNLVFGSPKNRKIPINMKYNEALKIAQDVFYKLGETACFEGTKISIEANPVRYKTNFLNYTSDVISFVNILNNNGIDSIIDLGAIKINNNFSIIEELITTALPKLNHVHISEPDLKPAPKSPKEFIQIYKLLKKVGYSKSISIEMKYSSSSIKNILTSTDLIKRLIQKNG